MSTVTVDGSNGPGLTLTDTVFNNIASINLIASKSQLQLVDNSGITTYIDISLAATITVTVVTSTNYTVAIANA